MIWEQKLNLLMIIIEKLRKIVVDAKRIGTKVCGQNMTFLRRGYTFI